MGSGEFQGWSDEELRSELRRLRALAGTGGVLEPVKDLPPRRRALRARDDAVSWRIVVATLHLFDGFDERGVTEQLRRAGMDADGLRGLRTFTSFDTYRRMMEALEPLVSEEVAEGLGFGLLKTPTVRFLRLASWTLPSLSALVSWMVRISFGSGALLFRTMEGEVDVLGPYDLVLRIKHPPGDKAPKLLRSMAKGALARLPELLGAGPAQVEVTDEEASVVYRVTASPPPRGRARAGRGSRAEAMEETQTAEATREAYEQLSELNRELEARIDELEASAAKREVLTEKLRDLQKMEAIGRFAGAVAHDFNNLLTVILTHVGFLKHGLPEGLALEDTAVVEATVRRAGNLSRQLLAFGRQQVFEMRVLDVGDVLRGMWGVLESLAGEPIGARLDLIPGLGNVRVDPAQLEQVVVNLVLNARESMPQGGQLIIETDNVELDDDFVRNHPGSAPGPHVMIAVTDTGEGMPPEVLSRAVEPFFTTREGRGASGLGLSTAYGIVRQSGGTLWCYSEPGHGTTVKVYLPRTDRPADEAPPPPVGGGRSSGQKVLIVEDDDLIRRATRRILLGDGYQVIDVAHPQAALDAVLDDGPPIDLFLIDVMLPQMSGQVLARQLLERRPGTRLLFVSGYTNNGAVEAGGLDPQAPFLQKPFDPEALLKKVRDVLHSGGRP